MQFSVHFQEIFVKNDFYFAFKNMKIKNKSKNKIFNVEIEFCDDNLSKFIGLMFSKRQNRALIFKFSGEKIISLHMFFVFYPIDVLFLDKNKIAVDKKENFRPFSFYNSRKRAMYAVELPNGIIKKNKTEIGDKIEF